jgi:hypothetical protein
MEGRVLAGMLGLHSNALKGRWKCIVNKVGLLIIKLGEDVLKENVRVEMDLSPDDNVLEKKKISVRGLSLGQEIFWTSV